MRGSRCSHGAAKPPARRRSPKAHLRSTESNCRKVSWDFLPSRLFRVYTGVFRSDRNSNGECSAGAIAIIPALNFPAMCADNSVADTQSQPGALAGLLGGVERIEDAVHIGDHSTIVQQADLDKLPLRI